MKYKLITSDLDETLLNDEKHVGIKTRKAIEAAKQQGVLFVPNTGRGFISTRRSLEEIGALNSEGQYVISFNGGVITENKNERVIKQNAADYYEINELFKIGKANNASMHVYTLKDLYVCNLSDNEINYINRMGMKYHFFDGDSLECFRDQPLMKMLYMDMNRENLDEIRSQIPQEILQNMSVTYSSNRYMEFNKNGVNKGDGLLSLSEMLGIDPSEVIAIGDNSNDLSMLEVAGMSVAVKNATSEVKEVADWVTENDYNHDAVGEMIEKLILNI